MLIPAGTPACRSLQIEGVALGWGAAAGNVDMPLLFRNKSTIDCTLRGYPEVTVIDSTGRVLARGSGTAGQGTFFADGPVLPVLLPTGRPQLPPQFAHGRGATGQAFMNLSWYDCASPQADHLAITLPDSGGVVMVAFPVKGDANPACWPGNNPAPTVDRGPFSPAGPQWVAHLVPIRVTITAPSSVRHGTTISYFVTVSNDDESPFDLRPCADYVQTLLSKVALSTYQLSCDGVASLQPGQSSTFEMRAEVPASTRLGTNRLGWFLYDGRIEAPGDSVPLTIT